jgi:outer membrane protein assembly factor BamB
MLVLADAGGKVVCVDLGTGQTLWVSEPDSATSGLVHPPEIEHGMVLGLCNAGRSLACWNLSSGKLLAMIEAKALVMGGIGPRGTVVALADGDLSVREPGKLDRPVWARKYTAAAGLLAVTGDAVILAPNRAAGELEQVSLATGAVIRILKLANLANMPAMPIECETDGASLYVAVTCAPPAVMMYNPNMYGGGGSRGLGVQKFDLKTGVRLWQTDVDSGGDTSYGAPALVVGRTHVVLCPGIAVKENSAVNDPKAYVVDASDGRLVRMIDPQKAKGEAIGSPRSPQRLMTPPVMTNGRLILENVEGVTVYGGG